jgi:hypothetical protein
MVRVVKVNPIRKEISARVDAGHYAAVLHSDGSVGLRRTERGRDAGAPIPLSEKK